MSQERSAERWRQVRQVLEAALEHEPHGRESFLTAACGADASLRVEVESLLAAHADAGGFIERPVTRLVPPLPERGILAAGQRLGQYEIVAFIGSGGMGEVYRARDPRLQRDVAIKVLTGADASDPELLRRFQNESRIVCALSHPNIVTVHDVGEADGAPFFAMELVQGDTLRSLLSAGLLPLRKALHIAAQMADGLAAAHDRGVVHRDLKPENVVLTTDGLAKILDFGLAKLPLDTGFVGQAPSDLETRPGTVLGTVGYMAPEQARGQAADFRSDQFALGAILYEMIEGRSAFERASPVETLAAVMRDEPEPLSALPRAPQPLRWILERCLAKDAQERYGSTRDLARDLARLRDLVSRAAPGEDPVAMATPLPGRRRPWMIAAALGTGLALGSSAAWLSLRTESRQPPVLRHLTDAVASSSISGSPDGQTMAFVSSRDGGWRIWLKQVATGAEAALTDGPADGEPRFSPDGESVLFVRNEEQWPSLYRVSILGGEPRRVLEDVARADISPDGKRLAFVRFARDPGRTSAYLLGVAAADGSAARIVQRLEALQVRGPRWSPDSRSLAFSHAHGAAPLWSIRILDPDTGQSREVAPPERTGAVSAPLWSRGGRELVYSQADSVEAGASGSLVRQELGSGRTRSVMHALNLGGGLDRLGPERMAFTVETVRGNLLEIDLRNGSRRWLTRGKGNDRQPCYARDGRRVVFSSNRDSRLGLWEVATDTGRVRRLTEGDAEDWDPHVMASGRLAWSSKRTGNFEIWTAEPDGTGARQVTHDGVDAENATSTSDGSWIVYVSHNPKHRGVWKIRPAGTQAAQLVAGTLGLPEVSPDGQFVLYGEFIHPRTTLRVARLWDGEPIPFEIAFPHTVARAEVGYIRGRARWMADGRAIAFVDVDVAGRTGIFAQDFVPGKDTSASRRPLAGFDPEAVAESFGISPDGAHLTLALREGSSFIVLAEGLEGVER